MLSQVVIAYLVIGASLVLIYPLRQVLREQVRKARSESQFDSLINKAKPAPAWKFVALAVLAGIAYALIWPVAIVSWYRHFR